MLFLTIFPFSSVPPELLLAPNTWVAGLSVRLKDKHAKKRTLGAALIAAQGCIAKIDMTRVNFAAHGMVKG